jgi:membrane protease YdiL (CAAX protease family)
MSNPQRFYAGLELVSFFAVWFVNVWGVWRCTGASIWTAAGFIILAGIVAVSIKLRRPDWTSAGFRLDNLGAALRYVCLPVLLFAGLFLVATQLMGISFQLASAPKAIQIVVFGVVQQAFFLGYLWQRWNIMIGNPIGAVVANAFSFALVHLPHLPLVTLTALGGLFLGALFVRTHSILAVGLAHGLLSALIVPTLRFAGTLDTTQIGPPELSPLALEVARQLQPEDRIGIGPHGISPIQIGQTFTVRIERIGDAVASEEINRDQLLSFLHAERRVFCFLSEQDFRRYVNPFLTRPVFLLGERYVWRKQFNFDRAFFQDLFTGSGDIPVLAGLRQRVLLFSNRPAATG